MLSEKTVLRGGYSRTYDLIFNNIYLNIYSAFPFTQVNSLAARTPNSYQFVYGLAFQGVTPPAVNPLMVPRSLVGGDFRSPYAEQVSFQIQRELARDWGLTVGYVGTKGTALFQTIDGNPTVPGSGGAVRVDNTIGVRRLRGQLRQFHLPLAADQRREAPLAQLLDGRPLHLEHLHRCRQRGLQPSNSGEVAVSQDSYTAQATVAARRTTARIASPSTASMNCPGCGSRGAFSARSSAAGRCPAS